jgi:hypothetical protein
MKKLLVLAAVVAVVAYVARRRASAGTSPFVGLSGFGGAASGAVGSSAPSPVPVVAPVPFPFTSIKESDGF